MSPSWSTSRGREYRYDGATGEFELGFYPLGITSLATEAATIGQPDAEAA
jgi:hypothetical protein